MKMIDLYAYLTGKDPFYIFDVVTENRLPHIKEEAIRHLHGLKDFENQLRDFKENGKFESMFFTISIGFTIINIEFLESKQTLDLFKGNSLLGAPGFDCYSSFHNDRYHKIGLQITPKNFLKMEPQFIRNQKLKNLLK